MRFAPKSFTLAALLAAAFCTSSAQAGPFLYYSYDTPDDATDGMVTDNSGNGRDGTVNTYDSGTAIVDGDVPAGIVSDQSLALTEDADGDGARVDRTISSGDLNFNADSWTVATWYQRNDTDNRDFILHVGAGDGFGGENELYIYQESGSDNVTLQHVSGGNDINISTAAGPAGSWHHVTAVHDADSSVVRFYVDGALAGTDSSFNFNMSQSSPVIFGGQNATSGAGFANRNLDGKLDDSAIWSSALSTFAVESLANGNLDPNAVPTKRSPDLFLYYSFEAPDVATDGSATDNSGNGRTGNLTEYGAGTATYVNDSPTGILGSQSLQLDVTDNANAAQLNRSISTSDLNFSAEDWTFASWYKTTDTGTNMLMHIGTGDGFGTDNELYLNVSGGTIDFVHYYGSSAFDVDLSKSGLDTAEWHHAVVAFDADTDTFMFYVDGELVGAASSSTLNMDQSTAFRIGGQAAGSHSRDFNGLIDDAALWSRTLSEFEIGQLYSGAQLAYSVIPEPGTLVMLPLAAGALLMRRRRAA